MLIESLFEDLAEYFYLQPEELRDSLNRSHQKVVDHWKEEAPEYSTAREDWYRKTDTYLLELAAWILDFPARRAWHEEVIYFSQRLDLHTALDFGAGIASEGLQLAQNGLQVDICEVNKPNIDFLMWRAQKYNLSPNLITSLVTKKYDLGVLLDVIGHVEDPLTLITKLARSCKYIFYTEDFYSQEMGDQNWPMHSQKPAQFDRVFNTLFERLAGEFFESKIFQPRISVTPTLKEFSSGEGGVKRVVEALQRYLPEFGYQIDDTNPQFHHNNATGKGPFNLVYTSHGIYPPTTRDPGEQHINSVLRQNISTAYRVISVGSEPKEYAEKNLNVPVQIIRNGVPIEDMDAVPPGNPLNLPGPYFLWSKMTTQGVCDPTPAIELARSMPNYLFVFTLLPPNISIPPNIHAIGRQPHDKMLQVLKNCAVYLGTTKENFSIQTLEAMAMRKPVLCLDSGGNAEVVQHKRTGYIAVDQADLLAGARWCLENAVKLGENGRKLVEQQYHWRNIVKQITEVYESAIDDYLFDLTRPIVSVIIPHYNLPKYLPEAIQSVLDQTFQEFELIIVDDGSSKPIDTIVNSFGPRVRLIKQQNAGVSAARNAGIRASSGKYICCLDSDDKIQPTFLEKLVAVLESNWRIGIAYTDFELFDQQRGIINMPEYDFQTLKHHNIIPCCNLFRRTAWERTGGYKNINPSWEDYELWLNMGKMGFVGQHVPEALFLYRKRGNEGRDFTSHGHEERLRAIVNSYHPDLYTPKVSIIIPSYKHADLLPETLQSIDTQTYRDFEVIIVDDGNDNPQELQRVVSRFQNKSNIAMRLIRHEKNQGLAASRNTGVFASRGEYILTLDSDDLIKPTFLERTVSLLDERPDISIAYTDIELFGPAFTRVAEMPDYDFDLLLSKNLFACASPYRRTVFDAVGGYSTKMIYGWEDYLFWIQAGRLGHCALRIPEPLFMYRRAGETMIIKAQKHVSDMRRQLREFVPDVFRGERPMGCCGKTRAIKPKAVASGVRSGFIGSKVGPQVGEYQLIELQYKGHRPIVIRGNVTGAFYRAEGTKSMYVDPRDANQLLSRGDFIYKVDESAEIVLSDGSSMFS